MRSRFILLTFVTALLVAPAYGQNAKPPAKPAPSTPPPDVQSTTTTTVVTAPVVAPPPEVAIKDTESMGTAPSKGAGHDTLSVDFPDEEIRNILRNVAELFDLNLVIPDTLQGKTSVKLHDVTWRQIFQVVLTPVGYSFIEDGNIIKIVSNESLTQEPVGTEIFVINYAKASDIQPTLASLVDAAAGGKIVIDARTNSLVITERPSRMKRIRPVIDQLDRPTDQVMIESKFVEISNTDVKNIGVNWSSLSAYNVTATPGSGGIYTYTNTYGSGTSNGNSSTLGINGSTITNPGSSTISNTSTITSGTAPTSSSTISNTAGQTVSNSINTAQNILQGVTGTGSSENVLSAVFSADQFKLVLSALQTLNNSKIVSNPTIVTLNNTEAQINIGQQFPIPEYQFNQQTGTFQVDGFQYKDIGIILKVTPQVNARGFIKLTLAPEVSQSNGSTSFGGASGATIPIIATRKAVTQVSLKDGYTMGIGGLISTNFNKVTNKIPFLGSIPLIGYLFKQESTNNTVDNLVIFITAKTISAEGAPVEQVFNSKEVRAFQLRRSDMPGYRDGSDPFINESPQPNKRGNQ
jgi:type II secretory pathway component GspD/PulD (secretin)